LASERFAGALPLIVTFGRLVLPRRGCKFDGGGGKPNIIRILPPSRKMGVGPCQGKRRQKTPTKQ
jgi:hypothetical protein